MDEEIAIIDSNTRKEKIKNFFITHKKKLIISFSVLILILFSYFIYDDLQKKIKKNLPVDIIFQQQVLFQEIK